MARVFISYSHADEQYRQELQKHLSPLRREGIVEDWTDRCILSGDEFDHTIRSELEEADVILLLVSADFLASNYCNDVEMRRALERHEAGDAKVIPVILRPCDWPNSPFGKLLATPTDGKEISKHPNVDDGYLDVVRAIRAVLTPPTAGASPLPRPPRPESVESPPGPRSANLGVRKDFSDYDRESFRLASFEYISNYFENSLSELMARNPELACIFRRVDGNTLTATAYSDGTRRSGCRISLGDRFSEIVYSEDENSSPGSMSEWLTVEHDGISAYLKPGGMRMREETSAKLTQQGAAEYFWSIFMRPMQP